MDAPDMIPAPVRAAARVAHDSLREWKVPHLLVGGMAVNAYGYPRMTADVDYLVPRSALPGLPGNLLPPESGVEGKTVKVTGDSVRVVVDVDFVGVPRARGVKAATWDTLFRAPRNADGLPLVALEGLVLLKLVANRTKDGADIVEILKRQGQGVAKDVRRWLIPGLVGEEGRDLLADYDMLVLSAANEAAGRRNPPRGRRP